MLLLLSLIWGNASVIQFGSIMIGSLTLPDPWWAKLPHASILFLSQLVPVFWPPGEACFFLLSPSWTIVLLIASFLADHVGQLFVLPRTNVSGCVSVFALCLPTLILYYHQLLFQNYCPSACLPLRPPSILLPSLLPLCHFSNHAKHPNLYLQYQYIVPLFWYAPISPFALFQRLNACPTAAGHPFPDFTS